MDARVGILCEETPMSLAVAVAEYVRLQEERARLVPLEYIGGDPVLWENWKRRVEALRQVKLAVQSANITPDAESHE